MLAYLFCPLSKPVSPVCGAKVRQKNGFVMDGDSNMCASSFTGSFALGSFTSGSFAWLRMTAAALNKRGGALAAQPPLLLSPQFKRQACHPEQREGPLPLTLNPISRSPSMSTGASGIFLFLTRAFVTIVSPLQGFCRSLRSWLQSCHPYRVSIVPYVHGSILSPLQGSCMFITS